MEKSSLIDLEDKLHRYNDIRSIRLNHLSIFVVTNNDRISNYDTNCISERNPDNLQHFIINEIPYLQLMTKRKIGII